MHFFIILSLFLYILIFSFWSIWVNFTWWSLYLILLKNKDNFVQNHHITIKIRKSLLIQYHHLLMYIDIPDPDLIFPFVFKNLFLIFELSPFVLFSCDTSLVSDLSYYFWLNLCMYYIYYMILLFGTFSLFWKLI